MTLRKSKFLYQDIFSSQLWDRGLSGQNKAIEGVNR